MDLDSPVKMAANFHRILDHLEEEYGLPGHQVVGYEDVSDEVGGENPGAAVKYTVVSDSEELDLIFGVTKSGRKEFVQMMAGHPPTESGWVNTQVFIEYLEGSEPVYEGIDAGLNQYLGTVADQNIRLDEAEGTEHVLDIDQEQEEVRDFDPSAEENPYRLFSFTELANEPKKRARDTVVDNNDEESAEQFTENLREFLEDTLF